jgi:hypothetical protein
MYIWNTEDMLERNRLPRGSEGLMIFLEDVSKYMKNYPQIHMHTKHWLEIN